MNSKDVNDKLEKIEEKLDQIVKVQIEQAADLKHHIYRTDLAEDHLKALETRISPIEKHVSQVSGVLKFFGLLGIAAGIVKAVIEVVNFLS